MPRHRPRTAPVLLMALALVAAVAALPALAQGVGSAITGRLAGDDRIGTAVAISQRAFPDGAPAAYLANAGTVVDAVAGGSLTDGPILLVPQCELPDAVAAELERLAPQEVLALGGPAAVCDDVLAAAGVAAARGEGTPPEEPPGDQPDFRVTATAELVDVFGEAPFTVDATDPGPVFEGGTAEHLVTLRATEDGVVDDLRFSGVLTTQEDEGQLVVTGPGCAPETDGSGEAFIVCTDDFRISDLETGEDVPFGILLHTDDAEIGPEQIVPGTYVLEQAVRWETSDEATDPAFDDGSATIRVTYTVEVPTGTDTPEDPADEEARAAVVTWDTPEGSFRTNGHRAADLARIAEGVERGEHIGIPNGVIHEGDGGVNTGRSWHLTDIELVDVTVEVCDGTADYVEAHLEDYLHIGRYCPWGAVPTAID
jgi:hypothetical protein